LPAGLSDGAADVPADLVAGVNVYKSRSANQTEGGIAGLIDVRTRRPFDFDGIELVVAAREVYIAMRPSAAADSLVTTSTILGRRTRPAFLSSR
jgi:hypothetical protein